VGDRNISKTEMLRFAQHDGNTLKIRLSELYQFSTSF